MKRKSWHEITKEIYESIEKSNNNEKRLLSNTFWRKEFRVKKRTPQVILRISGILKDNNIKFSVKSGIEFGKEKPDDWIILKIDQKPPGPKGNGNGSETVIVYPTDEWFIEIKTREFESEKRSGVLFYPSNIRDAGIRI